MMRKFRPRLGKKTIANEGDAFNILQLCLQNPTCRPILGDDFLARSRVVSKDIKSNTASLELEPPYASTIEVWRLHA